ncbi:MAG: hypothetical protein IJ716_16570 [Lachnospiraceae bacterium]|nr:hypothetical protein [Lachnospiraceae bacterium]
MVAQEVINEIDRVIKACWKEDIPRDYMEGYLLREDSLNDLWKFIHTII